MANYQPDDGRVQDFWQLAQRYAHVGDLDAFMGKQWSGALAPPTWRFGDTPEMADELLDLVVAGVKTATSSLLSEYEGSHLPRVGDLSIILSADGTPRVLVKNVEVKIIPFGQVTAAQAAAEGEGDQTLQSWQLGHLRYWRGAGHTVDDDTMIVWERFKVVYP